MNGLFGANGCNPDGSIGQNAFTSMADRMMDSHFLSSDTMAGVPNGGVMFVEDPSFQSPMMAAANPVSKYA